MTLMVTAGIWIAAAVLTFAWQRRAVDNYLRAIKADPLGIDHEVDEGLLAWRRVAFRAAALRRPVSNSEQESHRRSALLKSRLWPVLAVGAGIPASFIAARIPGIDTIQVAPRTIFESIAIGCVVIAALGYLFQAKRSSGWRRSFVVILGAAAILVGYLAFRSL